MTNTEISRMHVRCEAGSSEQQRALALRQRLERTARTHLPGALESVLAARSERIFVDRLSVGLDFDPTDYDDVTVANLWAACIDAAISAHHERTDTGASVRSFRSDRAYDTAALEQAATTGSLSWVFAELGLGTGLVSLAAVLEALARTTVTRARDVALALAEDERLGRLVYSRLAPAGRRDAVEAFARTLGESQNGRTFLGRAAEREASHGQAPSVSADEEPSAPGAWGRVPTPGAGEPPPVSQNGGISLAEWRAAFARLASSTAGGGTRTRSAAASESVVETTFSRAARSARANSGPVSPTPEQGGEPDGRPQDIPARPDTARAQGWSRVAGLAFLYPWLTDYLEDPLPPLEPLEGRLWALGALADPADELLALDPLVRILAGHDSTVEPAEALIPSDAAKLVPPAEELLTAFAASLPGFGESTAAFVRAYFLARGGLLERLEPDSFLLVLEPAPLDPILALLPYPLESFRLPWTPTVSVRRRDADALP